MIKNFLKEKRSWILFILSMQGFSLFVASIDHSLSFSSMLYIIFISTLSFVIFLLFRYQKEGKFYKYLIEREDDLDLTSLPDPSTPFEEMITTTIFQQTERLQKQLSENTLYVEQEKDELLAWIHEIKTPLTALHLLLDQVDNKKLKDALTFEWLRIHLLLDQQLHQKRMPFIKNDLYIERINLEAIVFDEIKTLQAWCMQKGIGFDLELEKKWVLTDGKWIAFLLRQLLTNAVKYSDSSDIFIHSYTKDEQIFLQIKDQGIGIAQKDLPRIFERGFTSTTNHQNTQATGMGLYLSKKIADSLLIQIQVQSTTLKGTMITLIFPKENRFVHLSARTNLSNNR